MKFESNYFIYLHVGPWNPKYNKKLKIFSSLAFGELAQNSHSLIVTSVNFFTLTYLDKYRREDKTNHSTGYTTTLYEAGSDTYTMNRDMNIQPNYERSTSTYTTQQNLYHFINVTKMSLF